MHGMLNRIDSAAAAEAAQLLEAEVVARELLQAAVDKISGVCLQRRPILPLRFVVMPNACHHVSLPAAYYQFR